MEKGTDPKSQTVIRLRETQLAHLREITQGDADLLAAFASASSSLALVQSDGSNNKES